MTLFIVRAFCASAAAAVAASLRTPAETVASSGTAVTTPWPTVVTVFVWALDDPELGRRVYRASHVPGAAFLDVDRDLSAPPGRDGRHPLPSAAHFAAAAARAGIGDDTFVVAYGSLGGADRLWWMLRHFGHDACAVLVGGIEAWGGPLEAGEARVEPETFVPR